mmetsp:Transcript_13843/g.25044  ORF Transcript_13843/g.25044 Transcript_13843/m.25044 type:complete len:269 (-) Transcript_13843:216-1022(-)
MGVARRAWPKATGNNTLLHNFDTNPKNGSSILFPKNLNNNAGVIKIPAKLLMTVLHNAVATFPPLADVNKMHMLIVVGKHIRISIPSNNGFGNKFGKKVSRPLVNGRPTRKGHAPNVAAWIIAFSFMFFAALLSSASLRLRPERRKMTVTPYFPMNSSGRSRLPFLPSSGKSLASETATTIPSKKKFFDTKAFVLSTRDDVGEVVSPPRTAISSRILSPSLIDEKFPSNNGCDDEERGEGGSANIGVLAFFRRPSSTLLDVGFTTRWL